MLRPLQNKFLFVFMNHTTNGVFVSRNKGKILIVTPEMDTQGTRPRWAKVLAVGNKIEDFKNGDIVLIAPGRWTLGFRHDDTVIWQSDDEQVLGVGDDSMAFEYGGAS